MVDDETGAIELEVEGSVEVDSAGAGVGADDEETSIEVEDDPAVAEGVLDEASGTAGRIW